MRLPFTSSWRIRSENEYYQMNRISSFRNEETKEKMEERLKDLD